MSEITEQIPSTTTKSIDQAQKAEDFKGEHLYSLLIQLRARSQGKLPLYVGHMAHASLLHWMNDVNPACATLLHEPNKRRPFTCSSLWFPNAPGPASLQRKNHHITIFSQHTYWLRLTLLTEQLFLLFMSRFFHRGASLSEKGDRELAFPLFTLGDIQFDVVDITSEASERKQGPFWQWSKYTTYTELVEHACTLDLRHPRNRQIGLEFGSPTTFSTSRHTGGRLFWLFPDPERVFDGLARSWNYWCPTPFALNLLELQAYIRDWVNVASYQLETQMVHLDCTTQMGFVGQCFYNLLEKPKQQMEQGEARLTSGQALHLLNHYALYAGVGQKTTMGMGQVHSLR